MENDTNIKTPLSIKTSPVVKISPNKMQATLELPQPTGKDYTLSDLLECLSSSGVKQGIDKKILQRMIDEKVYYTPITVAVGKDSVDGEPGTFQYFFRTETAKNNPKILADGTVDYLNNDLFEMVTVGQVIAEYTPPTNGEFGFLVTGDAKIPKKGVGKLPLKGVGFTISDDNTKYFSVMNGKIEKKGDRIEITNVFNVQGDLDLSIGNVRFDGDVHVKGNVISGLSIMATGDVIVEGHVEGAAIKSGKNVVLMKGMTGGGIGKIEAFGNVSGKFFESSNIVARGWVKGSSFLNCQVSSEDFVEVTGFKGVIIGGNIKALSKVEAQGLGSASETPTSVETGVGVEYLAKYKTVLQDIAKIESDITVFERNLSMFEKSKENDGQVANKAADNSSVLEKVRQALDVRRLELVRKNGVKQKMDFAMNGKGRAMVAVSGPVYPGVRVTIDSATMLMVDCHKNIKFINEDANVVMRPLMS